MDSSSSQFGGCGHTCANSAAPPQRAGWFLCRRRGALGEETLGEVAKTNETGGSTRSVEFRRKTVGSRRRHFFGPLQKKRKCGQG
ncbi:hypothetical protein S83_066626 [Arachis hypogaea]